MASYSETRTYNLDPKALGDAIASAATAAGLREKSRTDTELVAGEAFSLLKFSWPAKIVATLKPDGARATVDYKVSNFGFGPINTGHCKSVLKKVTDALAANEAR